MQDYAIEAAGQGDMPAIMELERRGFPPGIVEDEAVFRARLEAFPEGFVLLREGGRALGYLCAERWAEDPGASREAFSLGHDPWPRHAPKGRVLYIASMTLDPKLRGRGLGARLFREGRARILARASGIDTELLIVNETWSGARRIYEAEGFAVRGRFEGFFPPASADGEVGAEARSVVRREVGGEAGAEVGGLALRGAEADPRPAAILMSRRIVP